MKLRKKYCVKCGKTKSINKFSKYVKSEDGLQGYCKECNKEYQKERHYIENNNWKLYRVTIDIRTMVGGRKSYYIGITQKDLKDRLNEHISGIRNKNHHNFLILEMFKYFPYSQLENIDLRKYIKIELLKEYPSTLTETEMREIEQKAIYEQSKYSCEVDEWTTEVLNIEYHYGNTKLKKHIKDNLKDGIIVFEERPNLYRVCEEIHGNLDKKNPSIDLEVVEGF